MSNQSTTDNSQLFLAGVIVIGIIGYVAIRDFSALISVDIDTGWDVAVRLFVTAVVAGLWIKFSQSEFSIDWPFLLLMLWVSVWPALNYWANASGGINPENFGRYYDVRPVTIWWNAWYTKTLIAFFLFGFGSYNRIKAHN